LTSGRAVGTLYLSDLDFLWVLARALEGEAGLLLMEGLAAAGGDADPPPLALESPAAAAAALATAAATAAGAAGEPKKLNCALPVGAGGGGGTGLAAPWPEADPPKVAALMCQAATGT
jgi:hypothetical protein